MQNERADKSKSVDGDKHRALFPIEISIVSGAVTHFSLLACDLMRQLKLDCLEDEIYGLSRTEGTTILLTIKLSRFSR